MTEPIAVSVQNLSKKFQLYGDRPSSLKEVITRRTGRNTRDFCALNDVTLEILEGSFCGLIGQNGSGTSTHLRVMAGIHNPNSGSATSTGRVSALLELRSGFHPDLTCRENICLNGAILGLTRSNIEQSIESIIEFSSLGDFIETPVKAYSSGMYVRLGFAVAVNVEPGILLVIESPVFGIGILLEAGVLVSRLTCEPSIDIETGTGYFDLEFDRFPVLSGNFFVSTTILSHDRLRTFNEVTRVSPPIVQPASGGQGERLVELTPIVCSPERYPANQQVNQV